MATSTLNNDNDFVATGFGWKSIYRLAGIAALIILPFGILDIFLTFLPGGATPDPGEGSVKDWFMLFEKDVFLGLRGLGIFNIISFTLGIPVFLALYAAHRRLSKPVALFSAILFFVGAGIYISNNPAFAMQTLSAKYIAATTDYQRSLLSAAGEALLAGSEDYTPGSFMAFFLINLSGLIMSVVMLINRRFNTLTGWMGFGGFASRLIYVFWASFIPYLFPVALVFGILGGLLTLSWYVLVAQRLFKIG